MKTTTVLTLPKFTAFGGTLLKCNKDILAIVCLVIVALWNTHSVTAVPIKIDPIVVALPNATPEDLSTNSEPEQTTSIDVESVSLVELGGQQAVESHAALTTKPSSGLPDYILELNDPDIGGPVDYEPARDQQGLNFIAWDLLPPLATDIVNDKTFSHNSITSGHKLHAEASQESSQITEMPRLGLRNSIETTRLPNHQDKRGQTYYTSTTTTPKATAVTRIRTTTTAKPTTTTTPRTTTTTTTRRTTTPRSTTTTTPTTTTSEPDSSEFFKLEAGDSYTLPAWLQDIDDADLDVAVTFEIPEDINEYNHTIERDLLAPLEPYTDLNVIHLTPPTNYKDSTTTTTTARPTTTTRTSTSTTTTTRRPTGPRYQPHWVRAKPTTSQPTTATFSKQFTSHPSITSSSTNFAQRTTSTTTSTNVKPKSSITFYNRQISSNTAQTDKLGSSSSSSEEDNPKSSNSFLHTFDDGKYKPQQQNYNRRTTFTTTSTTTTTTTTTPAPLASEQNPFEATIPTWLRDFDYPDLGPGVPFIYDPNEDEENPVDKNILPPAKTEQNLNPTNPNSNPTFSNAQTPQGLINKFSISDLSLTSSSSIPSITIIPSPLAQPTTQDDSTRPPQQVFVTPASDLAAEANDDISKNTSSTFNKNFAAPFDTSASSSSSSSGDQNKVPLSADRESFPPFNNIITSPSTASSKTTFSKSEDGKVITNNIFLNGGITSSSTKPIGSSQVAGNTENNSFTTQSSTGSSLTTSAAASAFVTSSGSASTFGSSSTDQGSKYTGRFGGPPGVLAPQVNDFAGGSSTAATKSAHKPAAVTTFGVTSSTSAITDNRDKFIGSFGGPPGVLKPYDNVKSR